MMKAVAILFWLLCVPLGFAGFGYVWMVWLLFVAGEPLQQALAGTPAIVAYFAGTVGWFFALLGLPRLIDGEP